METGHGPVFFKLSDKILKYWQQHVSVKARRFHDHNGSGSVAYRSAFQYGSLGTKTYKIYCRSSFQSMNEK